MTYAFVHLIIAWLFIKLYEKISKKKLSLLSWGFLLLGSILPDADIILGFFFNNYIHRTWTHSLLFAVIVGIIVYIIVILIKNKHKAGEIALPLAIGILFHLFVDLFFQPGIYLFWPWQVFVSYFGLNFTPLSQVLINNNSEEVLRANLHSALLDMGIGVAWLAYFWLTKRIKF